MDKKSIISSLSLKEKASLLVGYKNMLTYPIKEKEVASIVMSDGPNGIRKEDDNGDSLSNISKTSPSTCFPTGITIASSWNIDLINKMGVALGKECAYFDIDLLLGPAINIQRNPLCGRNFEYLTEDPFLAGRIGISLVDGIQAQNVGACVKHYACNNNEKYRFIGDSIVDDRALHEIYLKPFEMVVKKSKPMAIMSAYNQVNGHFCSENKYLIENILRSSWSFDGVVLTDWGGMVHRDIALENGCDLEMPGSVDYNIKLLYDGVKNGTIKEELLDKSVERLLELKEKTVNKSKEEVDFKKHYDIALSLALEGAVLLKNKDNILPLNIDNKYLIVGDLFKTMRYQGSGSSLLNPILIKDHLVSFDEKNINYDFSLGYNQNESKPNNKLEEEAVIKAKEHDTIVIYCGLNDYVESEGYDRDNLKLPENQLSLINKLTKSNKKIIVVLFGGGPIELPFINDVEAILDMMLPGEAGGDATTRLLFGLDNPSGKLSQSWPINYEDVPFGDKFISNPNELYKESIFVGYRFYNSINKEVLFPFGYGLSYTSFKYSNMTIKNESNDIVVTFNVKNIGIRKGKEIAQLYIEKKDSNIVRPAIELKGFSKFELEANEEKEISISINYDDLAVYHAGKFVVEDGKYELKVGSSSKSLLLSKEIVVKGITLPSTEYDEIYKAYLNSLVMDDQTFKRIIHRDITDYEFNKKPYTMETPIGEFNTFFGKMFKNAACNVGLKQYIKACKLPDGLEKEREKKAGLFIYKLMPNNSLRSLSFSSSGMLKYNIAEGILELSNGHFFKGIKKILKKYKIKELK